MEAFTNDTNAQETSFSYGPVFILGFMIVFTVASNLFMLSIFILNKSLHIPNNNLVISLCISDLLTGLLVIPFALAKVTSSGWRFGVFTCALYLLVNITTNVASRYSICTLVIVRACAAQFPIQYRIFFTRKVSIFVTMAVWVFSTINGSYMIAGWSLAPEYVLCHVGRLDSGYVFSVAILDFIVPLVILILGSVFLVYALRHQSRQLRRTAAQENSLQNSDRRTRQETAATRQATVITIFFLACNLSFFTYYLLAAFYPGFPFNEKVYHYLVWIMFFNSSLNPCLYIIINKNVRAASLKLLRSCSCQSRSVQEVVEPPN